MEATIIEVGDLVRQDRLWRRDEVGVVVKIYHKGSVNEGLKVKMTNGAIVVAPTDEWSKA